ncbi:MAG TPA: transcriptional regulator [Candidatus Binataceae bacterium]|nr:transcriptional regulator [Candidatus Binataceae bacterium]
MSKIGRKLIKAAKEARAFARGETTDGFIVHVPDDVDVKALRKKLKCSQSEFSRRFGFAIDAVQDWEQRRRTPDRTARIFLTVIAREPEAVARALEQR